MSIKNSRKNGILFLLGMLFFALFSVYLAKSIKVSFDGRWLNKDAQQCSTCSPSREENIVTENVEYVFLEDSNATEYAEGGEVKGEISSLCRQPANIVDLERRLCSSGGAQIHYEVPNYGGDPVGFSGDEVEVENIVDFELTMVTYPLALWLGPYTMKDSNRQIRVDDPSYSSSGEWEGAIVEKTMAPYQSDAFVKELPATERQAFEVTGQLTVSANQEQEKRDGRYNIDNAENDPACNCPREVSTSDFNVGASNLRGDSGGGFTRQQIPGGDNYDYQREAECLSSVSVTFLGTNDGVWKACDQRSIYTRFKGLFRQTFSSNQWDYCDEDGVEIIDEEGNKSIKREKCPRSRGLMVEMTPIFGNTYDCNNGICSNAFMTYTYLATQAPFQTASKKEVSNNIEDSLMFYVATQCSGIATYDNGATGEFDVWCLWDATPFLMNYRMQAKDKAPGQEDFIPTFIEYWNEVLELNRESAKHYLLI
jgi:hypothetical protein